MIPPINKILYASDQGEHTRPVFRRAVSLARRYEAKLLMVHVVEPLSAAGNAIVDTYLPLETADKLKSEDGMHEVLEKVKKRLQLFAREELRGERQDRIPDTEVHVVMGTPSREILRIAEENNVDVIVMGKSAHSFFGNTMMGTCARRVTRYSNIPVFLIPNN
ncbi:universal stress protein [Desulfogranum mediterraneum]|uniref:universal stress protein n=1 Tax=Desulfogranum mediterraneum TaxID=160661 RepID=UPI0003F965ED|nr:universal stress protein [Desulfogranum mediterraneum]